MLTCYLRIDRTTGGIEVSDKLHASSDSDLHAPDDLHHFSEDKLSRYGNFMEIYLKKRIETNWNRCEERKGRNEEIRRRHGRNMERLVL